VSAVTAVMLFIVVSTVLVTSVLVSRRLSKSGREQKREPPGVPPRPKERNKFTVTRNEAYRVPTETSVDDNDYTTSYVALEHLPTNGTIQSSMRTSRSSDLLMDSHEYVIPSLV
jgi:hypothetical protein